jgi:hypothetical protein
VSFGREHWFDTFLHRWKMVDCVALKKGREKTHLFQNMRNGLVIRALKIPLIHGMEKYKRTFLKTNVTTVMYLCVSREILSKI